MLASGLHLCFWAFLLPGSSFGDNFSHCHRAHEDVHVHHQGLEMKAGHGCNRSLHIEPGQQCPSCTRATIQAPYVVMATYERDLCKATYALNSIAKYDKNHNLGNIILLWVSQKPMEWYAGRIKRMIRMVARTRHVTVKDLSPQFRASGWLTGWEVQQAAKLKSASIVPTEYMVVLDSKNTFGRLITERTFFTECNQGIRQGHVVIKRLDYWTENTYHQSARLLGVPVPKEGHWPESITPAVWHKATVLKMLAHIGESHHLHPFCDGPLCAAFKVHTAGEARATEFSLYHLYAHHHADFQCLHAVRKPSIDEDWNKGIMWLWHHHGQLVTLNHLSKRKKLPVTFGAEAEALKRYTPWARHRAGKHLEHLFRRAGLRTKPHTEHAFRAFYKCIVGGPLYEDIRNTTESPETVGRGPSVDTLRRVYLQASGALVAAGLLVAGGVIVWRAKSSRKSLDMSMVDQEEVL